MDPANAPSSGVVLKATELMVFYENMLALNNITLSCGRGTITGIFGSNSAGKSTLMHMLSGIILDIQAKEKMRGGERITLLGKIEFNGRDVTDAKPHARARAGIILCPERRRIFPESTVLENLKIGGYLPSGKELERNLEDVFDLFPRLKDLTGVSGGFLSGGEQQMLAVGRALMAEPEVLLMDEPLLGLSPAYQRVVVNAIKEIRDNRGITIVVSEQYAVPLLPVIDYGYIIENGSAVLEGKGRELTENPDVKSAYFGV